MEGWDRAKRPQDSLAPQTVGGGESEGQKSFLLSVPSQSGWAQGGLWWCRSLPLTFTSLGISSTYVIGRHWFVRHLQTLKRKLHTLDSSNCFRTDSEGRDVEKPHPNTGWFLLNFYWLLDSCFPFFECLSAMIPLLCVAPTQVLATISSKRCFWWLEGPTTPCTLGRRHYPCVTETTMLTSSKSST
jgi:hypothetical protein